MPLIMYAKQKIQCIMYGVPQRAQSIIQLIVYMHALCIVLETFVHRVHDPECRVILEEQYGFD